MDDERTPWEPGGEPWQSDTAPVSGLSPWAPPGPYGSEVVDADPTYVLPGAAVTTPLLPSARKRRRGVSRRNVLIGMGAGALGLGAAGAGFGVYLAHRSSGTSGMSLTSDAGVLHLLRRAGFGVRPGEMTDYLHLGINGTIERLFNPTAAPDHLDATLSALNLAYTKPADLQRWFILRMIYSQRPLEEKMTLFWHGVLTSSLLDVRKNYQWMKTQVDLLRTHALGRFDDLIHAITLDPAMMWYLDLHLNRATAPNENYARELMELFTMGLADAAGHPNYTQDDVVAGARALTGWVTSGDQAVFLPRQFDGGAKTYLGHTGNWGLDDVVKFVCAHPSTPYHLAWRMWSFFAYENPSVTELQPLIDAYTQQNHSIAAMMRAMLTSPAFYGEQAYRQRVKSPSEYVVGALRALELPVNGQGLAQVLNGMGQELLNPPNVSGWDGDKVSANWMSTQAWMTRVNFVNMLLTVASTPPKGGANSTSTKSSTSALQTLVTARQIATPSALLDFFALTLLDGQLATDRRATIAAFLTAPAAQQPTLTLYGGQRLPLMAVRDALYLLMSMPEYQLN